MSGAAPSVKVLLAGDINGKIDALFKRVNTVNTSNGPFAALLCVGSFFSEGADDADYVGELLPYINGEKSAPVPTYFIGGFGIGSNKAIAALASAPDCSITYLGRAGVSQIQGLQIAYLDGTYNAAAYRSSSLAIENEKNPSQTTTTTTTAEGGCRYFSSSDVDSVKLAVANAEGDIDFLLTNGWPTGVCTGLPEAALPPDNKLPQGSEPCAELAAAVRPRYHIAGGEQLFYARAPYLNPDLGAGTLATRFISLGNVGNTTKQKWLHALGVVPASQMTPEELSTSPQGATQSPYLRLLKSSGNKRAAEGQAGGTDDADLGEQSWRWQDRTKRARAPIAAASLGRSDVIKDKIKTVFVRNVPFRATEDDIFSFFSQAGAVIDIVRRANQEGKLNSYCHIQFGSKEAMERACQLNGSDLMGRQIYIEPASTEERPKAPKQVQPVQGCWFCLSNPNADTALVASVGEECYVALDKGPITDKHVLILPVEHYACTLDAPASTTAEMDRYMSSLKSCFAAEGKELVAFERFMRLKKSGGNHCHVNVIAVPADSGKNAAGVFESIATRHGFGFTHLPPARGQEAKDALAEVVKKGEYFLAFLPDGSRLVHPIAYGERHPLNYGREVLAELAGVPHRADWKECQGTPDEEEQRTEAFRNVFKEFDILLNQE